MPGGDSKGRRLRLTATPPFSPPARSWITVRGMQLTPLRWTSDKMANRRWLTRNVPSPGSRGYGDMSWLAGPRPTWRPFPVAGECNRGIASSDGAGLDGSDGGSPPLAADSCPPPAPRASPGARLARLLGREPSWPWERQRTRGCPTESSSSWCSSTPTRRLLPRPPTGKLCGPATPLQNKRLLYSFTRCCCLARAPREARP